VRQELGRRVGGPIAPRAEKHKAFGNPPCWKRGTSLGGVPTGELEMTQEIWTRHNTSLILLPATFDRSFFLFLLSSRSIAWLCLLNSFALTTPPSPLPSILQLQALPHETDQSGNPQERDSRHCQGETSHFTRGSRLCQGNVKQAYFRCVAFISFFLSSRY
jgi:hypothetical protein